MKSLLKKLLPALALTLLIGGTVTASVINHKVSKSIDLTYYGVKNDGTRVLLDNPPSPDDCDAQDKTCYIAVDEDQNETPFPGGAYTGE